MSVKLSYALLIPEIATRCKIYIVEDLETNMIRSCILTKIEKTTSYYNPDTYIFNKIQDDLYTLQTSRTVSLSRSYFTTSLLSNWKTRERMSRGVSNSCWHHMKHEILKFSQLDPNLMVLLTFVLIQQSESSAFQVH